MNCNFNSLILGLFLLLLELLSYHGQEFYFFHMVLILISKSIKEKFITITKIIKTSSYHPFYNVRLHIKCLVWIIAFQIVYSYSFDIFLYYVIEHTYKNLFFFAVGLSICIAMSLFYFYIGIYSLSIMPYLST